MEKKILPCLVLLLVFFQTNGFSQAERALKFVIFDFDGLNLGQTDLPDGDYRLNDLSYQVAKNPLNHSEMLGDRVLELKLNWDKGNGTFGKGISKFIELDQEKDYLNFYIYNSPYNSEDATIELAITEDDNGDHVFKTEHDDIWKKEITVQKSNQWQLVSLPLSDFSDANTGGNGIFDAAYTNAAGMILQVSLRFMKPSTNSLSDTYYIDMLCFSEGPLPHGESILDLPKNPNRIGCSLGAHSKSGMVNIGAEIQGLFPYDAGKKLRYIHSFYAFSNNGQTSPNNLPGSSIKTVLDQGYRPIITLEPLYSHLPLLHSSQPKLLNIVNGDYDDYLLNFGKKLAAYNDTIILRIMHEFDGNWYPWSISANNQDTGLFIKAFQKIVNTIRSAGAEKVLFLWSPNSSPVPSRAFNWCVNAYPGDAYVDLVGTNIYNHPAAGTPDWKSFRYLGAEVLYYLQKYFPEKPILIGELGIRERYAGEPAGSQSKGSWFMQMDQDLQTFFHQVRGLVFFNENKEHDWRLNSSNATLAAVREHIWNDNYYFGEQVVRVSNYKPTDTFNIYPNPSSEGFTFVNTQEAQVIVRLFTLTGKSIFSKTVLPGEVCFFGQELATGLYLFETLNNKDKAIHKLIKR